MTVQTCWRPSHLSRQRPAPAASIVKTQWARRHMVCPYRRLLSPERYPSPNRLSFAQSKCCCAVTYHSRWRALDQPVQRKQPSRCRLLLFSFGTFEFAGWMVAIRTTFMRRRAFSKSQTVGNGSQYTSLHLTTGWQHPPEDCDFTLSKRMSGRR